MERVVAVEVLHLLAAEGLHAAAVQELLDASEVWRAYRDQKHDLFLPAGGSQQVLPPLACLHQGSRNAHALQGCASASSCWSHGPLCAWARHSAAAVVCVASA